MRVRVPGIMRRNFRLKATAFVIAIVVWSVVVYANNPPDNHTVVVPVSFSDPTGHWVLDQQADPISVRVTGTRDHIAAFDPARVTARVDTTRIARTGVQDVPIIVTNLDPDVDMDPPPATTRAAVDAVGSLRLTVVPNIVKTPPAGFLPRTPTITPGSVVVEGPTRIISQLRAQVDIDLSDVKTNYSAQKPVILVDPSGNVLNKLPLSSSIATVEIIIDSAYTSRAVPVIVRPQGSVAPNHYIGSLLPNPQTVVLNGPQTVLNQIDFVSVPVSVVGLYGSVTVTGIAVTTGVDGVTATPGTIEVKISVLLTPPPPTAPPTAPPSPSPSATPTPTPSGTPGPSPT